MSMFARPIFAIIFGAFIVCAETCEHIGDIVAPSAWTDLPLNDWFAGAFPVYGGVAFRRNPVPWSNRASSGMGVHVPGARCFYGGRLATAASIAHTAINAAARSS